MENGGRRLNKCEHRTKCVSYFFNHLSIARKTVPEEKLTTDINVKGEKSIVRLHYVIYVQKMVRRLRFMIVLAIIFASCLNFADCARIFKYDHRTEQNQLTTNGDYYSMKESLGMLSPLSARLHRQKRDSDTSIRITGLRVEDGSFESADGVPSVLSNAVHKIRVFGTGLSKNSVIAFTTTANTERGSCLEIKTDLFRPDSISDDGFTAEFTVKFEVSANTYFICSKNDQKTDGKLAGETKPLEHQGDNSWTKIQTHEPLLPTWAAIMVILLCLCFSALFSGLNLGLMALDRTELKILRNTGSPAERKYAAKIQPVRDQGNYLLCSILLGNVLVNSTFTILLDGLTSGLVAVICSTIAIVLFGEITPQAICSRHGLAIGAKTIYITKTIMAITAPLSYPVSRILDAILGEEIGNVYNRERLKELVRVTTGINDLDKTEVNIISGALELRKKTVADIMTHIDDAFMLSLESVLDFETVSEIMKSGYSRIPVYDGDRKNIVTLLYIKDLAFVDTDDNTPLKTLCEFYQNPVHFVFEDYTLDVMFNQFKDGTIGHLAFVHRVNNEGDGDPFYETVGLVTLEDVIEELIQAEIVDEFDVFIDNRTKIKRNRRKQDFTSFAERREAQSIRVSPQLALATFQYLSTAVDAFKPDVISENILRRLLTQDVFHNIKAKGKTRDDPSLFIFQQGKAVDFFVLILEGRVEVTIGKEALMFESGPFTYFGTQALVPNVVIESPTQVHGSMQSLNMDSKIRQTFVPDYSVRATSDIIYITIRRNLYLTAKKATLLEKSRKSGTFPSETVEDEEVERLLNSITDDDKPRLTTGTQSFRQISKSPKSITSGTSIDHISEQQKVNREDTSVNSFASSENPADLPNGEHENSAISSPLLPKPNDNSRPDQHSSQQ